MDKSLHDLVKNYGKLRGKTPTPAARKIGYDASRCSQFWAAVVPRFYTQFWHNFQPHRAKTYMKIGTAPTFAEDKECSRCLRETLLVRVKKCRAPSVVGILDQSIPRSVGLITKQGSIASLRLVVEAYSTARVHIRTHALCTGVLTGYDSRPCVIRFVFTNTNTH